MNEPQPTSSLATQPGAKGHRLRAIVEDLNRDFGDSLTLVFLPDNNTDDGSVASYTTVREDVPDLRRIEGNNVWEATLSVGGMAEDRVDLSLRVTDEAGNEMTDAIRVAVGQRAFGATRCA